jgi:hypothetical protein
MTGKADRPWPSWSGEVHRVKKKRGYKGKENHFDGTASKKLGMYMHGYRTLLKNIQGENHQ